MLRLLLLILLAIWIDIIREFSYFWLQVSVASALPLGIVFTFSQSEAALTKAFQLLGTILPTSAFYGRGEAGPAIFMSDNCGALRSSLHPWFPLADLLLCIFHTLQAMWRYLWGSAHKVVKVDRLPKRVQALKKNCKHTRQSTTKVDRDHLRKRNKQIMKSKQSRKMIIQDDPSTHVWEKSPTHRKHPE